MQTTPGSTAKCQSPAFVERTFFNPFSHIYKCGLTTSWIFEVQKCASSSPKGTLIGAYCPACAPEHEKRMRNGKIQYAPNGRSLRYIMPGRKKKRESECSKQHVVGEDHRKPLWIITLNINREANTMGCMRDCRDCSFLPIWRIFLSVVLSTGSFENYENT